MISGPSSAATHDHLQWNLCRSVSCTASLPCISCNPAKMTYFTSMAPQCMPPGPAHSTVIGYTLGHCWAPLPHFGSAGSLQNGHSLNSYCQKVFILQQHFPAKAASYATMLTKQCRLSYSYKVDRWSGTIIYFCYWLIFYFCLTFQKGLKRFCLYQNTLQKKIWMLKWTKYNQGNI